MILLDYSTTGDGILTGVLLAGAILSLGQKPSALTSEVRVYPQVLKNVIVSNDNKYKYLHLITS
jgi:phosphoglucosamine mutase